MNNFQWIKVYQEICKALLHYKEDQKKLLEILWSCGVDKQFDKKVENGKEIKVDFEEVDPFTVLSLISYKKNKQSNKSRGMVQKALIEFLGKNNNLDIGEDLDSLFFDWDNQAITSANPNNKWYFPYKGRLDNVQVVERKENHIQTIWNFFERLVNNNEVKEEEFKEILNLDLLGITNLSIALSWIKPHEYIHLSDSVKKKYDLEKIKSKDWQAYKELLEKLKEDFGDKPMYEIQELIKNNGQSNDADSKKSNDIEFNCPLNQCPLNQILYGPAGTGKTYHTINHALAILEGCDIEKKQTQDDRNNFKKYMKEGRIQFVTFHQSYGYEEFVEGIKVKENNGQISYSVESGIFKRICEDAQTEIEAKRNNVLAPIEESINNAIDKLISKAKTEEIIFYTKRGSEIKVSSNSTGTLFALTSNGKNIPLSLRHIRNYLKIQNEMIIDQKSYEWVIANSLRPEVQYSDTNKINPYILIIDEINRGNISKIFGELITLIEESKREGKDEALREGKDEALSVILPYSGESFSVPSNLYIIGTMNSSDRSLTSLDLALRRRFEFIEMLPDPKVLKDITIGNISVKELLEIINKRIKALLDQDHCIGHANFTHLTSSSKVQDLMNVFEKKIIPLLQEYFFNDWEKINLVLGNNGMIVNDKIDADLFPNMDSNQIDRLNSRSWIVNKALFKGKEDQITALKAIVSPQSKTNGDSA